jgi:uncharacterized protein GlcG (DUF336 family)
MQKGNNMIRNKWLVLCGSVVLAGSVVTTLALGAAAQNGDKPAGPQSLPADNLPPFNMLDANGNLIPPPPPPPGGYHHPGDQAPETTAVGPTLDQAVAAARAAIKNCTSRGYYGAATIVDSIGEVRASLSADGADGSHVFVAQRKAITALEFKMPSSEVRAAIEKDKSLMARVKPNMFVQFGGFPITSKGKVIGAIGYSGGDDVACAKAGLEEIEKLLK